MNRPLIILPAAGSGSRLGLPYSKEIMRVNERQCLIDFSFDHFAHCERNDVEFLVVINERKTDIIKYLSKYKQRFDISFIFQDPDQQEYTGAIKSARPYFRSTNVVLLPDTKMQLFDGRNLMQLADQIVDSTGFGFFYKKENNHNMLKTKGALSVNENSTVTLYQDKPQNNIEKFNAFWCALTFTPQGFDSSIAFMENSTLKLNNDTISIERTALYGSKGAEVKSYVDLGTWPELTKFFNDNPTQ